MANPHPATQDVWISGEESCQFHLQRPWALACFDGLVRGGGSLSWQTGVRLCLLRTYTLGRVPRESGQGARSKRKQL